MTLLRRAAVAAIALMGMAVLPSLVTDLPPRPSPEAESAAQCPIVVTVSNTYSAAYQGNFGLDTEPAFEGGFRNPGTDLQVVSGSPDVVLRTTPPSPSNSIFSWQVAASVWAVVPTDASAPRIDYSNRVRGDDYVNFARDSEGVDWIRSLPGVNHEPVEAASRQAIPDWDVNLDGTTSLGDLGRVAARWGQTSTCKGWIRADANNNGAVSLADIGAVTNKWGLQGMCGTCLTDWQAILKDRVKGYAFNNEQCNPDHGGPAQGYADPISLVIRMNDSSESHLQAHGLPEDITQDITEVAAAMFQHNHTHFYDNGSCAESEIMLGSDAGYTYCPDLVYVDQWCLEDRLHVRGHVGVLLDPQHPGLSVTPLTPHYDVAWDGCGDERPPPGPVIVKSKHLIPEDFWGDGSDVSGFTAARDILVWNWLSSGHHTEVAVQNWGNTDLRPQLCTTQRPSANGIVVMLGKCGEVAAIAGPHCEG
jgi:hypothetical protein